MRPERVKVFIVDDAKFFRVLFRSAIERDPEIEVVGTAADPSEAWPLIKETQPHVVLLDIEMPKMDGLTFLRHLMQNYPLSVIIVSSLTGDGCRATLDALEAGAVDVFEKTSAGKSTAEREELLSRLRQRVRAVAKYQPTSMMPPSRSLRGGTFTRVARPSRRIVAIGASTGGTEAIRSLLSVLDGTSLGVLIVIHMPPRFVAGFAARLDAHVALSVHEAREGEGILDGHAYLAPGDRHMTVSAKGDQFRIHLHNTPPVGGHRPSVDVLFDACAKSAGPRACGVILTGMGKDGAAGLSVMRAAGGRTFGQDARSCVVFGMPKAAGELGAVEFFGAPHEIAVQIKDRFIGPSRKEVPS